MKSIHALTGAGILLSASSLLSGQTAAPNFAPPSIAPLSEELPAQESIALPPSSPYDSLPLASGESLLTDPVCDVEPVRLYSSRFAIDITLADFALDDGEAGYRTTKPTAVRRADFAIERVDGLGVRAGSFGPRQRVRVRR